MLLSAAYLNGLYLLIIAMALKGACSYFLS